MNRASQIASAAFLLSPSLAFVLGVAGCAQNEMTLHPIPPSDAGPSDAMVTIDAPMRGDDGGAPDGGPDGGPAAPGSRIHVLNLGGRTDVFEASIGGVPVHVTSGVSHDGEVLLCEGSMCFVLDPATGVLSSARELRDGTAAAVTPTVLLSGNLGGSAESLLAFSGATVRLYDAASASFGAPVDVFLESAGGAREPFRASSAAVLDLGTGPIVNAFRPGDDRSFVLGADLAFRVGLPALHPCDSAETLHPKHVLAITPAPGDVFVVTEESYVFIMNAGRLPAEICFDPLPGLVLRDAAGEPIDATVAIGHQASDGRKMAVFVDEPPTL